MTTTTKQLLDSRVASRGRKKPGQRMNLLCWPNWLKHGRRVIVKKVTIRAPLTENVGTSTDTEKVFRELVNKWKTDTEYISSVNDMCMHMCYQRIIGMGEPILPLLFRELQENPDYWFWALAAITRQNPVSEEDMTDFDNMVASWLNWGKKQGFVG